MQARGINSSNVHNYLTPSGILLVYNPQSTSSKVRLCVDPSRQCNVTKMSVNDNFKTGFPHIPDISKNLVKSQFYLTACVGDVSNFYTNNHLDIQGSLLSAVYLQQPADQCIYPTLDPARHVPLEIYLYTGSKFGFTDAGSLSCLAKSRLTGLYNQNYPKSKHKIPGEQLIQVNNDLKASYVDNIHIGITLVDIHNEKIKPTFAHKYVKKKLRSSE